MRSLGTLRAPGVARPASVVGENVARRTRNPPRFAAKRRRASAYGDDKLSCPTGVTAERQGSDGAAVGMKCGVVEGYCEGVKVGVLVLVENYIAAQPWQFIAQATGLTVPRTPNGILGYAGFRSVLHPGHAVAVGIVESHPRPSRK